MDLKGLSEILSFIFEQNHSDSAPSSLLSLAIVLACRASIWASSKYESLGYRYKSNLGGNLDFFGQLLFPDPYRSEGLERQSQCFLLSQQHNDSPPSS